jgi:hypothetical protein
VLAAAESPKPISVWVFNLYYTDTTLNKVREFFDYLTVETGYHFEIIVSNDSVELLRNCHQNYPDIVVASSVVSDLVAASCRYIHIAQTFQSVELLVLKNGSLLSPATVKRVGLIRGVKATEIANTELAALNAEFEAVLYPNLWALMRQYQDDHVDSLALPHRSILIVQDFSEKWHSIHTFQQKGSAIVTVSAVLDKKIQNVLRENFLANGEISKKIWQQGVGLGEFVEPGKKAAN